MEIRYLGFDQQQSARTFRFDVLEKGVPPQHILITADLNLFLAHHVGIQEGPSLCAKKLAEDLESCRAGTHELTGADLGKYAADVASAIARRAEARKTAPRRHTAGAQEHSTWRNFGI